jgi:hypothetical protein
VDHYLILTSFAAMKRYIPVRPASSLGRIRRKRNTVLPVSEFGQGTQNGASVEALPVKLRFHVLPKWPPLTADQYRPGDGAQEEHLFLVQGGQQVEHVNIAHGGCVQDR